MGDGADTGYISRSLRHTVGSPAYGRAIPPLSGSTCRRFHTAVQRPTAPRTSPSGTTVRMRGAAITSPNSAESVPVGSSARPAFRMV